MTTLDEHAFLQLLERIGREEYAPDLGERAVICRTYNSRFNPVGLHFAFVGAVCGILGACSTQKFYWRILSVLFGPLCSVELSWAFHDPQPCSTFFNDIRSVEGRLRDKASEYNPVRHLNRDYRRFFTVFINFFTFERTLKWLFLSRSAYSDRPLWFRHLKIEWFDGLQLDPLTMWYWRLALLWQRRE